MKNAIHGIIVLYFEFKADRLRPAITKYLYKQRDYWRGTLEKIHDGDKVTTDIFQNEEEILKNIHNIEDELSFDNKYQLLKLKYRNEKRMLVSIASDYFTFWSCLDFFRTTSNLNAANPTYENIAIQFGSEKTQIYTKFENLLNR